MYMDFFKELEKITREEPKTGEEYKNMIQNLSRLKSLAKTEEQEQILKDEINIYGTMYLSFLEEPK